MIPIPCALAPTPRPHPTHRLPHRLTVGQEMLDFCAQHNVVCDIERIAVDQVNDAMVRRAGAQEEGGEAVAASHTARLPARLRRPPAGAPGAQ